MKDLIKGMALGAMVGVVVGGVVVAKNKKLATKIKDGLTSAEGKLNEAKTNLQEKMSECDCLSGGQNCDCESDISVQEDGLKEKNKKFKN